MRLRILSALLVCVATMAFAVPPAQTMLNVSQRPVAAAAPGGWGSPTNNTDSMPASGWLVGDDPYIAAGGSNVVQNWVDRVGGLTFSQATAAWRPSMRTNLLNGHTFLNFDGVDDFISRSMTLNQPVQVTMVLAFTNYTGTYVLWGDLSNSGARVENNVFNYGGGGQDIGNFGMTNTWCVITWVLNGSHSIIYTNLGPAAFENTQSSAVSPFGFAANPVFESQFSQMNIAEIIWYSDGAALPFTNGLARTNLYSYAYQKYGNGIPAP